MSIPEYLKSELLKYGVTAYGMNEDELYAIYTHVRLVGRRMCQVLKWSCGQEEEWQSAFELAFPQGLRFKKSPLTCREAYADYVASHPNFNCWGSTTGNTITIYANAPVNSPSYGFFLVHEMGHAFDNAHGLGLSGAYRRRLAYWRHGDWNGESWTEMPGGGNGLNNPQGDVATDPFCVDEANNPCFEQAADMFMNWIFGIFPDTTDGDRRANWTNMWIRALLTGQLPILDGINCDEDTGNGC